MSFPIEHLQRGISLFFFDLAFAWERLVVSFHTRHPALKEQRHRPLKGQRHPALNSKERSAAVADISAEWACLV